MDSNGVFKTPGWKKRAKRQVLEALRKAIRAARAGRYERARGHILRADEAVELFNPLV